jgi:hypothetical protein
MAQAEGLSKSGRLLAQRLASVWVWGGLVLGAGVGFAGWEGAIIYGITGFCTGLSLTLVLAFSVWLLWDRHNAHAALGEPFFDGSSWKDTNASVAVDPVGSPRKQTLDAPSADERYGERHQELRAHWASIIRAHGGTCSERICVMPTRRIEPGAYFHLAHDHVAGGHRDYLGPAHPECNEHEANLRGVTWQTTSEENDVFRPPADKSHDAHTDRRTAHPSDPWGHDPS